MHAHLEIVVQESDGCRYIRLDSANCAGGMDDDVRLVACQIAMHGILVQKIEFHPARRKDGVLPREGMLEYVLPDHSRAAAEKYLHRRFTVTFLWTWTWNGRSSSRKHGALPPGDPDRPFPRTFPAR